MKFNGLLPLLVLFALFVVPQAAQASSQNGADMVVINPGGGQLEDGSDGLLSVFNGESVSSPNFLSGGQDFAPNNGSDQQFFAGTYQWCCGGAGPILYAGTPTIAPLDPFDPDSWGAAASKFVGEVGAASNNDADSWSVNGGGVEIISTSGAVARVPAGDGATAFPAGAPTGSGSATIRYKAKVGGLTYVIDRAISYTYPNNFYTETYTFTVPSGNTDPVQYYLGGDAAPGSDDDGRGALTTSPNRVLYEINENSEIFVAYGEVGSPATSPFSSGYVADYNDPVYDAIERGYSLVTGCGFPEEPDQEVVDTNFCIDQESHDAGMDIQWTLPATPGTYTRQMRTIVGFQGQSVSARFTPSSVASGQSSNLEIELVNTGFDPVNGVGFSLPLPTGLSISGDATNSCNGTLTATSGGTSVALTGGNLPGGGNCLVSVPVTGAVGTYTVNDQAFQDLEPETLTKGFGNSTLDIGDPAPSGKPKLKVNLKTPKKAKAGKGFAVRVKTENKAKNTPTRATRVNGDPTTAYQVKTCVRLPKGLFVINRNGGKVKDRTICWTRSSLAAGRSANYKITVRFSKGRSGSIRISGTVSASNSAGDPFRASGSSRLRIVKPRVPKPKPPTG